MIKHIHIFLISLILLAGCTGVTPELGIKNSELRKCPATPNCVNSQATEKQHAIEPIIVRQTITEAKTHLVQILKSLKKCKITRVKNDYIRAEFSSSIFGFTDDVEFYFQDMNSNKIIIHVRSASRIGRSDFDVNRKRIEQISKQFQQ